MKHVTAFEASNSLVVILRSALTQGTISIDDIVWGGEDGSYIIGDGVEFEEFGDIWYAECGSVEQVLSNLTSLPVGIYTGKEE